MGGKHGASMEFYQMENDPHVRLVGGSESMPAIHWQLGTKATSILWIPEEICDIIMDHLRGSEISLAACSLVCSEWMRSARYHLFRDVRVERSSHSANFLQVLGSPLCTFAPFVRSLSIRCPLVVAKPLSPSDLDPLSVLLSRLTALRRLAISAFLLETFVALVNLVSVFPGLQEIHLDRAVRLTRHFDFPPITSLRCPPASLRTIKVDDWTKGHLLNWVASQKHVPPVRDIRLVSIAEAETPDIGRYLRILGPSLEHLELSFSNRDLYQAMASFHDNVDLACATQLRSIHIALYMPWADWFLILSGLASPFLEEVIIDVWCHADDNQGSWDEMDLLFTLPQFSSLRRIRIGPIFHNRMLPKPISWMRQRLPTCHKRGILEFVNGGSDED